MSHLDRRTELSMLEKPKADEDTRASDFPLGDLVLRMMFPSDPVHNTSIENAFMSVTAIELKLLAHAIVTGGECHESLNSDSPPTREDLALVAAALGARLEAGAELCRRLTDARWDQPGFPGHTEEEGAPNPEQVTQ